MEQNISQFPSNLSLASMKSSHLNNRPVANEKSDVVNLGMYRLKKSLQKEGFEIVEDQKGKITLVVRVGK